MSFRSQLLLLTSLLLLSPIAHAETLRVLSWPGYVTSETVHSFEQQYGASVELVVIGSDDELWKRASLNGGHNFDVVALNTAELKRYIDNDLVVPLDPVNVPNTRKQVARFRKLENIPGLSRDGKLWAVPFTYSAMGLIYNRKLVHTPPDSMRALWEPTWRGRILLHNGASHAFSFTALTLGIRKPFKLNRDDFWRTLRQLVGLRDNQPLYYNTPEEAVEIMRSRDIALIYGNYGDQQVRVLRKAGLDVAQIIPKEGALAWLDCWAIMQGAGNRKLAEAWLNHMLTPAVATQLTEQQGLANTLSDTKTASLRAADKLIWLEPVEDAGQRSEYWERLKAGTKTTQ